MPYQQKNKTLLFLGVMLEEMITKSHAKFHKTTESIFEGLDSEIKTRIPGRSALVYRVKFLFRFDI